MAKRIIKQRAKTPIKNSHLINKGGKQITPVNGSYVEGYNKAYGKTATKQISKPSPTKTALKATTSLTKPNSPAFAKTVQIAQAKSTRLKGLQKLRSQVAKTKTQPSKAVKRPPTKGRGR